jgi:cyclophilin family peptidyl-prolyl cis-trans isomerase
MTLRPVWIVRALLPLLCLAGSVTQAGETAPTQAPPEMPSKLRVDTTMGSFVIQLETTRAPLTVSNFVQYVRDGHYKDLLFHRVVGAFVVQGGGYDGKYALRAASRTVANESGNGLSNKRGTVGLARSEAPHSGNAQFYVNLTDNEDLDPTPLRWGYAVFGKVIDGMEVVDRIGRVPTGSGGPFPKDVPLDPILIKDVVPIP